jgi:hypothetical protein
MSNKRAPFPKGSLVWRVLLALLALPFCASIGMFILGIIYLGYFSQLIGLSGGWSGYIEEALSVNFHVRIWGFPLGSVSAALGIVSLWPPVVGHLFMSKKRLPNRRRRVVSDHEKKFMELP